MTSAWLVPLTWIQSSETVIAAAPPAPPTKPDKHQHLLVYYIMNHRKAVI